ncbi:MAG: cysteine desulfurase family protein [Myxococcota bacterium]|nr:cysteine desulfurase family protein [Myxococcota bacterium]
MSGRPGGERPPGAARSRSEAPLYLDHHATTPVDPRVVDAMRPFFEVDFGNAASHTHRHGWRAEAAVELARESLAGALGAADPREVVFTSGATESDNLAIKGVVEAGAGRGDHVVTVATEHPAVLDTCSALEKRGVRVTRLGVDAEGQVDLDALAAAIEERTLLVSVMAANSEIGALAPLEAIGRICQERDVLFHTDAAQALGRIPLDVEAQGVDLLSCSAHKVYGPKGVGLLYVRRRRRSGARLRVAAQLHGGGHERGMRSGTLPVPLIVGFARAVELALADLQGEAKRLRELCDRLEARLCEAIPGVLRNGPREDRLPGNLNLSFEGAPADALLTQCPDLALSTGSACSSARPEPSHVLAALGLSEARSRTAIRFGIGRGTRGEHVEHAAARLAEEVQRLRSAHG